MAVPSIVRQKRGGNNPRLITSDCRQEYQLVPGPSPCRSQNLDIKWVAGRSRCDASKIYKEQGLTRNILQTLDLIVVFLSHEIFMLKDIPHLSMFAHAGRAVKGADHIGACLVPRTARDQISSKKPKKGATQSNAVCEPVHRQSPRLHAGIAAERACKHGR